MSLNYTLEDLIASLYSAVNERNYLSKIYTEVLELVPGFRDQIPNFVVDPEALDNIIDVVSKENQYLLISPFVFR